MQCVCSIRTAFTLAALLLFAVSAEALAPESTTPPDRVLRYAFLTAESGFDPVPLSDLYSAILMSNIFDTPLTYDYLARPAKVISNVAEMPEISADGKIWTLHVKKGIYFADDPAFKGKKREITAEDFIYSLKRHFDPNLNSQNEYLLEGLFVGMSAAQARAKATGKFDYDTVIQGIRTLDRYTMRFELTKTNYNFIHYLTYISLTAGLAREVVEYYGDKIGEHPVGTNAYQLVSWQRSSKMVFEANPNYRESYFEAEAPADDAQSQEIARRLKGRRLPMIPRVEVSVITESQPRWLSFLAKEYDFLDRMPPDYGNRAMPNGKLAPDLQKQGIVAERSLPPEITFTYFQMKNPIVGGYTPEKVALRRAISLGYSNEEEIRVVRNNQAIPAQSPIGPGVAGYDPNFRSGAAEYDPAKAQALLDTYGFVGRDSDGYRQNPDGSRLTLEHASTPTQLDKQLDELWKKDMDAIGIRMSIRKAQWPELLKLSKAGQLMTWGLGWSGAIPDADVFYVLLYGPNGGQANHSYFDLPAWNALYEQSKALPDGPERNAVYLQMNRLFVAYAPWKLGLNRIVTDMSQPWLYGYRRHPVMREFWKFIDVDPVMQQKNIH